MKPSNWVSMLGSFELENDTIVFRGGSMQPEGQQPSVNVGNFVNDLVFGGGEIRTTITFRGDIPELSTAGLLLYYHPATGGFVSARLGGASLCTVATFAEEKWTYHESRGASDQIESDRPYLFSVRVIGSRISVQLDGVQVIETNLSFPLPQGQTGLWALGTADIAFSGFEIEPVRPKLFVIMQFTDQFNEFYTDVIQPVGNEAGFEVVRADETFGPGIIIADIERRIVEAKVIIADITPHNPNVSWEVGYAHALRKPTILIAQRDTELPFDVSPFRTLFYDNTIAGKARIEEGLRRHIEAIQSEWFTPHH